jgi:uncharacterized protein
MDIKHIQKIAGEISVRPQQVVATVELLDGNATIPFISRYRKEVTGSLDEVAVTKIRDRILQLRELDKRRDVVLKSIQEQGKLTEELKEKVMNAETMSVLEDLYLPYRPKRRTKATVAKEKGLEELAQLIFEQKGIDLEKEAVRFVSSEKKVESTDEALAGARDIIAEWVSEDARARAKLRQLYSEEGIISSKVVKGKEKEGANYKDYFEWQQSAKTAPSHRILAVRRAEKETILMVNISIPTEEALRLLNQFFVKGKGPDSAQVLMAIEDSFKRLMSISLETEYRLELKKRADIEAIQIFSSNLRQLLMASPLGNKRMIAIDPGQRTGCKVVALDAQGKLLENKTLFLVGSSVEKEEAVSTLKKLVEKYDAEVIAIGNGTAGRETEDFVKSVLPKKVPVVMVNESGASVYSASDVAREEFPDYDVTVRGAISIGRRLMDPLAELVKIDPKAIGVGQYQHDVDQNLLKTALDDVVISCVNQVGVEMNTASKQLLTYVSGIGPARAQAIMNYRNQYGAFKSRKELQHITGITAKTFEQAAGFLRIRDAENPLDKTAVHPESYYIVETIAQDIGCSIEDLIAQDALRNRVKLDKYVTPEIGLPTLSDIKAELAKPGRDPRETFQLFSFSEHVRTLEDLKTGMKLPGIVTNITAFGAFVDIGVHHDGLIHISQLADRYVKDPHDVVKVHQKIMVTVLEIDLDRKRVALSARSGKN